MIVLDASVAVAASLPDEAEAARPILLEYAAVHRFVVPSYWRIEVASALLSAERRKRLAADRLEATVAVLDMLDIEPDEAAWDDAFVRLLPLARDQRLSVYDAGYLDLAMRLGLPLLTFDRALARAADAQGVHVPLQ